MNNSARERAISAVGVETEVEMIELSGATPREIADDYERVSNAAYAHAELRFSSFRKEMLRWAVYGVYLREINGTYFVEVERCFYNNPPPEGEEGDE